MILNSKHWWCFFSVDNDDNRQCPAHPLILKYSELVNAFKLAFKSNFVVECVICACSQLLQPVQLFLIHILPFDADMLIKMHAMLTTLINLRAGVIRPINNLDQELYAISGGEILNRCYFCPASSDKCKGYIPGEQPPCTNNWTSIFSSFCPGCRNSQLCLPSFPFETSQDGWLNMWVLNYISLLTLNAD